MDDERHDKFVHVESPGILKGKVRFDILVAGIESGSEEFLLLLFNKELKQFFNYFLVVRFLSCFDGISVDLIFFGEFDRLLVLSILPVEKCSNSSELKESMVFSSLSQVVRIDVGVFLNRFSQRLVVFNVKVEFIEGLIDFFGIGLLNNFQEILAELNNTQSSNQRSALD